MMGDVLKFIETLVEDMKGADWTIEKIVEGEKVIENDTNYLEVDNSLYEEQDNFYIKQWTG
jgi:hypothetical protein